MGKSISGNFIFLIISCMIPCLTIAQPLSDDGADFIARKFLIKLKFEKGTSLNKANAPRISSIRALHDPESHSILARIVHLEPKGFMIISAWQENDPLLSYSFEQNWISDPDTGSFFMHLLISDLRRAYDGSAYETVISEENTVSAFNGDETFYQWPAAGTTPTGGWVETKWIQGDPYNRFCPVDINPVDTVHSAVGCIALAFAQVLNYHRYIGNLRFDASDKYSYTDSAATIQIDRDSLRYEFPGFGELNHYLQRIENKYAENEALDDTEKAALCFAVGIALKFYYTCEGSSICSGQLKDTAPPLIDKFKYPSAEFAPFTKSNFWDDLIDNLINGLPAVIYLLNHAIIADGYDTEGYFHLNFGWAGDNPKPITACWYRPDASSLPGLYKHFDAGIINIKPQSEAYDIQVTASSDQVKIPCTKIGEVSPAQSLTLINSGTVPVCLDDILLPANFAVNPLNGTFDKMEQPIVIPPGGEFDLQINSIPNTLGKILEEMQILVSHQGLRRHLNITLCTFGVEENGTTVSGTELNGRLTVRESPFYICSDLHIATGQRLEIEAGTSLIFTGPHKISVGPNTRFIAVGTERDSIYFSTLSKQCTWQGIRFENSGSDDTLSYCVIKNVAASLGQAAIDLEYSHTQISHSILENNHSSFKGGAVYMYNSSARIDQCIFRNNICTKKDGGGALHLNNSSPVLANLMIYGNRALNGGAIYSDQSSLILKNLTIMDNTAQGLGAAIYLAGENDLEIYNTIIWNNRALFDSSLLSQYSGNTDTLRICYSDIDTTSGEWIGGLTRSALIEVFNSSEENCSADPLFVNPALNNFRLAVNSPCIDSGDPDDDYSAEPQPNGGRINLGAYGGTDQATISDNQPTDIDFRHPDRFQLAQNYPNPFNPSTTIEFTLPRPEQVLIEIYAMTGQKIITLLDRPLPAGAHKVEFTAKHLASGVYFYWIKAGELSDVKKMILLR